MATDSGAYQTLLAETAERAAAGTERAEEVAQRTKRHTSRRGSPIYLARYAQRKLASGKGLRGLSGRRRRGSRCQGAGRAGHLDTIYNEAVSFGGRDVTKQVYRNFS